MRIIWSFFLVLTTIVLASCATGPKADYEGISSSILSGKNGGIMGGFTASGNSTALLNLENIDTGKKSNVYFSYFPTYPRIHSLEPGTYKINSGTYTTKGGTVAIKHGPYQIEPGQIDKYNETGNLSLIDLWTGTFDVKAGEVTDLGVIRMKPVRGYAKKSGTDKVLNELNNISKSGTISNKEIETYNISHVSFRVSPIKDSIKKLALKKYEGLESRVFFRPLQLNLTESEFELIAKKAAQKGAGGILPDKSQVRENLSIGVADKVAQNKALKNP